jgi:hypothetical protein
MAEEFQTLRRDISLFLVSLRHSLDRAFRTRVFSRKVEHEVFVTAMLRIEEARLRFSGQVGYRNSISPKDWPQLRNDLLNFINHFLNTRDFDPSLLELSFRLFASSPHSGSRSPFIRSIFVRRDIKIRDALGEFRKFIESTNIESGPVQSTLNFEDLDEIVPRQQVSPIQFEILNGKISVSRRDPQSLPEDRANISSALDHIQGSGNKLIENLENSNCDRRLLESVKELQSQLLMNTNVVKIGLTNMACGIMCSQFQSELPDAIAAMCNSFTSSVSLYVAQFPEWEQFTQKAAQISLDDEDISDVSAAAEELIDSLSINSQLVDVEVPKTILFIKQFLEFPGTSAKRAAFAMIRTIENLVSSILRYAVEFINKTVDKTMDGLSSVASKVIISLLTIALIGSSGIGSAATRAGAPWVKQAAEIIQKQIEKVTE